MPNKFLVEAARCIAEYEDQYSCCAIERATGRNAKPGFGPLAVDYDRLMRPNKDRINDEGDLLHGISLAGCEGIDKRHFRVMLLLMAAQVLL